MWAIDITYVPLKSGYGYLEAVLEWASRSVLAWELSNALETGFCVRALHRAVEVAGIMNSDNGRQFNSAEWIGAVEGLGMRVSHDGRGAGRAVVAQRQITRTSTCTPMRRCPRRAPASRVTSPSTTSGGAINHWTTAGLRRSKNKTPTNRAAGGRAGPQPVRFRGSNVPRKANSISIILVGRTGSTSSVAGHAVTPQSIILSVTFLNGCQKLSARGSECRSLVTICGQAPRKAGPNEPTPTGCRETPGGKPKRRFYVTGISLVVLAAEMTAVVLGE